MVLRDLVFIYGPYLCIVQASIRTVHVLGWFTDRGGLDMIKGGQMKKNIKAFKARRSAKYFPLRNKIRKLDYSLLDNPQDGIERQMPHLR